MRFLAAVALLAGLLVADTPSAEAEPLTVITVGTSIENGTGLAAGLSWPSRLAQRAPGHTFTDMSKGGGAWTAPDENGVSLRDHMREAVAAAPDLVIVGGPVNDLVRLTDVGPLRQAVFEEVYAAQQAGVDVLVMGIFPFNDGGAFQPGWWPNLEQRRTTYNSWAAQMYGARYIDVTWCLRESYSYRGDNRWFRDGLHPTRVGAALIAETFPLERLP